MSSSSSSSSSSSEDSNGNGGGGARRRRAGGDYEGPSSSRRRAANEVWPEPFLEALATQVAIDAARSSGRLAAAAALANVFQVCSTWRAVSRSDLLWHRLTRLIWRRTHLLHATWRHEFMYRHRTALNFRTGRYSYYTLHFDPSDVESPDGLMCRCLTLSDIHLACGFVDGAVRLFNLATRHHVATFRPQYRDRLGQFSVAVSGIIITNNTRLVFATLDGDIHVVDDVNDPTQQPRRVHLGVVLDDGVLIDFSGCRRYWVGLYAGLAGRSFRIWNGQTEMLTFIGGSLTDQDAVFGWRMLTDLNEFVGRVRVSEGQNSAVACTATRIIDNARVNGRVMVLDLMNEEVRLSEQPRRGIVARSVDISREVYVTVDYRGRAIVRRVDTLEEVCRFNTMVVEGGGGMIGCMNLMYWLMCADGAVRVWEVERGTYVNMFRERLEEEMNAFVADDRHVAASSGSTLHLWDFGGGDVEIEEEEDDEEEEEA
ncbi:hypothetical protein Ddye_015743 [Dipteronia dyeriana]|uniref:Transcriptional regulator STERILE APETALA n=1 Tax=Dipteronia dyeriana TaxID=168575 RepID=A0AAD9WY71_9ROSI|nr:hypothetical protein Ddye_015743 [Dipteronia dyeriana]